MSGVYEACRAHLWPRSYYQCCTGTCTGTKEHVHGGYMQVRCQYLRCSCRVQVLNTKTTLVTIGMLKGIFISFSLGGAESDLLRSNEAICINRRE